MEKEKIIEEMARDICENCRTLTKCDKNICTMAYETAEHLTEKGWKKERQGEWISVEDRLPEKDGMYLIFSPYTNKEGGIVYCNRFLTKGNPIFSSNSFESLSKVTHWMPLPTLPQMKGVG